MFTKKIDLKLSQDELLLKKLLEKASNLYKANDLKKALEAYHKILVLIPNHYDSLIKLSKIYVELGELNTALDYYKQLLETNPNDSELHSSIGSIFLNLGKLDQALSNFEKALLLNPNQPQLYYTIGIILFHQHQIEKALENLKIAVKLFPKFAQAHDVMGSIFSKLDQPQEAISCHKKAIDENPFYADAHNNLGLVYLNIEQPELALQSFKKAVICDPNFAIAYNNQAAALNNLNRYAEALACCEKALSIQPNFSNAYYNKGCIEFKLKKIQESVESFNHTLMFDPENLLAYLNRGSSLAQLGKYIEAIDDSEKVLKYDPNNPKAYYCKSFCQYHLRLLKESVQNSTLALKLDPLNLSAYLIKGGALNTLNEKQEALNNYDMALTLDPNNVDAIWNKALIKLSIGNMDEGWQLYEIRWLREHSKSHLIKTDKPLWLGNEDLKDKTIYLHAEQGYGDCIQFCRYALMVKNLGAKVILGVFSGLLELITTLDKDIHVTLIEKDIPKYDYHAPLMSLPLAFKTNINSIPYPGAYLFTNPQKKKIWEQKITKNSQFKIGFSYCGNPQYLLDDLRSLKINELKELLDLNVEFHLLQKEIKEDDRVFLKGMKNIHLHDHEIHDFNDTAALIEAMDLVISVDTSVAHLAAALGKKTWILLPFSADFRWLTERSDSPWYSCVTLFRQSQFNDWSSVVKNVKKHVLKLGVNCVDE